MKQELEIMKALSDRNRLRVVAALLEIGELCACQVVELLQVTGATASRHMGLLLNAGLVESRKAGRWVYYRLSDTVDPLLRRWLEQTLAASGELAADRTQLARIVACDPEELCRRQRGEECCPK